MKLSNEGLASSKNNKISLVLLKNRLQRISSDLEGPDGQKAESTTTHSNIMG